MIARDEQLHGGILDTRKAIQMTTPTPGSQTSDHSQIDEVHVIFKTHLDIGFTDFAQTVAANYTEHYIPAALQVARELREAGGDARFIWTTGAWLIDHYLETTDRTRRDAMEAGIAAGDITWHGLPCTTHSELMDTELFHFGLSIARDLDQRYGRTTIAAKMTDVPGHTRGIVPLLAKAGLRFLHIGVNPGSTPPDVPPLFRWQAPDGSEIVVMYQKDSYGGLTLVADARVALAFAHTGDNHGPQGADHIRATFAALQEQFPHARVFASTLDTFATRVLPIAHQLPRLTQEIGDSWIHGIGTDPRKVAQFRELLRLRNEWLHTGAFVRDTPHYRSFSHPLLLVAEHTWGLDVKSHLGDSRNYAASLFHAARSSERFQKMEASWREQRNYIDQAVATLPPTLAKQASARLDALTPRRPDQYDLRTHDLATSFIGPRFAIDFDPANGAIIHLHDKANRRTLADATHPLAVVQYETFAQRDYDRFWEQYIINKAQTQMWARADFTKPGMEDYFQEYQCWQPQLVALVHTAGTNTDHLLLELTMPEPAITTYGAPRLLILEVTLPHDTAEIELQLQWFDKAACRLPEAIWFSFIPVVAAPDNWKLDKLDSWVSPLDVLHNGNRHLHAVGTGASYHGPDGALTIDTLDAPLIAPGKPALLNFTNDQPALAAGLHINLYNNVWGTNFPMWNDQDARFRFVLHV